MIKLNKTGGFFGLLFSCNFLFSLIFARIFCCCVICANGIRPVIIKHLAFSPCRSLFLLLADSLTRSTSSYVLLKGTRGFCLFHSYRFTAFSYAFMAFCYFLERNVVAFAAGEREASVEQNLLFYFNGMQKAIKNTKYFRRCFQFASLFR